MKKEDLLDAVNKALQNAEELYDEAVILKNNEKIARAYTLFQFSIEEIGKAAMTFDFALHGNLSDSKEIKIFLDKFRDHKIKTETSQGIDFMFAMRADESEFTKKLLLNFLGKDKKLSLNLSNNKKNNSLYVGLIDNKFCLPQEMISKKDLDEIELYANLRLKIAKPFFSLGVNNFEKLEETKHLFDEEKTLAEGVEKMRKLLDL
ncbi:MAG: hypothetical protein CFE23_16610 [Flavobacterium sp. BFFFF1]|uniref:AbiV family abortive infection protein n=1 Tax=Flavobacterium sp. BFFFF1 TaxID=2015557 RepID=UPI000BD47686|nr:AbiV family abortive infection protein [Flavobacterium sp. BFFFF1]OYU78870.1 MAG: hypothetical protein CFE23_16610 [Flavobacterium sp. BFFFF1]